MSREDAFNLDEALLNGDVSGAWMVWSTAAEKALADSFQLAGGPVPRRQRWISLIGLGACFGMDGCLCSLELIVVLLRR